MDSDLLSGYPELILHGYPMDSDIIKLVLLAIYLKFIQLNKEQFMTLILTLNIVNSLKNYF